MAKPRYVKIGPIRYNITREDAPRADDGSRVLGFISYDHGEIHLANHLTSDHRFVIVWHEILHGILTQAGKNDISQDESLVEALSHGIVQVLNDNPNLRNT